MGNNLKQEFLMAIRDSLMAYDKHGSKSNKKLIPIHKWFACKIIEGLGKEYTVKSLGISKEYTMEGMYYSKKLDISILKNENPIVIMSFKFATSNYAQNSNNYFENLLGETANIRRRGVSFTHFLVLRGHTPYFDRAAGGNRGKLKKVECLSEHHIKKYVSLFNDSDFPHKPDVLGIAIIDVDEKGIPYFTNLEDLGFSRYTKELIENNFSIETFINNVRKLCIEKS